MEEKVDVVIIGGGISGLCAAKLLKEQGVRAIVLEAQDRVGGRTHTVRDPSTYQYTDVGGAYVGPTQRRVARLANELGLEFYKVNKKEKTILYYEGSWAYYKGNVPPVFNIIKACDLNNIQRKLDAMGAEIPLEAPWKAKKAKEWDSMTVKEFLDKNCWTSFSHTMGTLICQGVFCSEAHEMSLLYFLWYIASGRGLTRVTSVTNGAQERKFVGGSMQLSEKIAEIIGEDVHLEQPVIRVEQTEKGAKVTTANNNTYLCDYVISGMPQALLNRVTFAPPLPPEKLQLIQRIPMGSIIKTMIFYEKAFWKENGYCGEMITDTGPVLYCMDDTKPDGSSPCIMGFILAQRARDMTQMTPEQRRDAIAKHYAKVFKMDEFLKPINYVEKNWAAEEYSGGCYVSTMPPGVLTSMGNQLQEPFDRVFFAGTETASDWAGYMEGAVQAGERAARQVLHAKGVLAEHEIYQDEPPCESFPEPPVEVMFIEKVLPSVPTLLAFCGAGVVALAAWGLQKYCDINFSVSWK